MVNTNPAGTEEVIPLGPSRLTDGVQNHKLDGIVASLQRIVLHDITKQKTSLEVDLASTRGEINSYTRFLTDAIRKESTLVQSLSMMNVDDLLTTEENVKFIQRQIKLMEGLLDTGKYLEFKVEDSYLVGMTNSIVINYAKVDYVVGKQIVKLPTKDLRNTSLKILPVGRKAHPHISGDHVCLGNISSDIPAIIARHEYGMAFDILHTYLMSYNDSSRYRKITEFPKLRGEIEAPVMQPVEVVANAASTGFWATLANRTAATTQSPAAIDAEITSTSETETDEFRRRPAQDMTVSDAKRALMLRAGLSGHRERLIGGQTIEDTKRIYTPKEVIQILCRARLRLDYIPRLTGTEDTRAGDISNLDRNYRQRIKMQAAMAERRMREERR